jgi:hypothetical protein
VTHRTADAIRAYRPDGPWLLRIAGQPNQMLSERPTEDDARRRLAEIYGIPAREVEVTFSYWYGDAPTSN